MTQSNNYQEMKRATEVVEQIANDHIQDAQTVRTHRLENGEFIAKVSHTYVFEEQGDVYEEEVRYDSRDGRVQFKRTYTEGNGGPDVETLYSNLPDLSAL